MKETTERSSNEALDAKKRYCDSLSIGTEVVVISENKKFPTYLGVLTSKHNGKTLPAFMANLDLDPKSAEFKKIMEGIEYTPCVTIKSKNDYQCHELAEVRIISAADAQSMRSRR